MLLILVSQTMDSLLMVNLVIQLVNLLILIKVINQTNLATELLLHKDHLDRVNTIMPINLHSNIDECYS